MELSTLESLEENGKARIVDTAMEGCVSLWEVDEDQEYIVLSDNTVITRDEDRKDDPFFP